MTRKNQKEPQPSARFTQPGWQGRLWCPARHGALPVRRAGMRRAGAAAVAPADSLQGTDRIGPLRKRGRPQPPPTCGQRVKEPCPRYALAVLFGRRRGRIFPGTFSTPRRHGLGAAVPTAWQKESPPSSSVGALSGPPAQHMCPPTRDDPGLSQWALPLPSEGREGRPVGAIAP